MTARADWVAAGTPEPLRSRLAAALGDEQVLDRALDLVRYASDASPYRLIPKAVVRPRDAADVGALLATATELGTPVVFRAGGTSLNGQSQTDSILVDVRHHWQRARIEDGGARRASTARRDARSRQPAAGASRAPARPRPGQHQHRLRRRRGRQQLGGMRCGVVADSYQTVRSMTLVLAGGAVIDTAAPEAEQRFEREAPELAAGLLAIRDEIRADSELSARIEHKFKIKNTTGYRLCAFLDADTPLEIFRRLVIGSEGTLAFVAEAVFDTVPLGRHTMVALVGFEDLDSAAAAVGPLVAAGATRDRADGRPDADRGRVQHARHARGVEGAAADLGRAAGRVPRRGSPSSSTIPSGRRVRSSTAAR